MFLPARSFRVPCCFLPLLSRVRLSTWLLVLIKVFEHCELVSLMRDIGLVGPKDLASCFSNLVLQMVAP
jgi:hypothetical protein